MVFESMYGATHEVADAVAAAVAEAQPEATVTCLRVGEADQDGVSFAAELVIVGGPTHSAGHVVGHEPLDGRQDGRRRRNTTEGQGHRARTRAGRGGERSPGLVPRAAEGCQGGRAAAFDTRGEGPMVGGAAKGIAHRLESHG